MKPSSELKGRKLEVLNSIVQAYMETGEPVASRAIARRRRDNLSAATIRNEMADLAEEGYLNQPHTSAGRVPTVKAIRQYVQNLDTNKLLRAELDRLRNRMGNVDSVSRRAEESCHVLTELTHSASISAAIPALTQELDRVELLSVGERRVLMILVTKDQNVTNRVVRTEEHLMQDDLERIRNYVNHHCSGLSLAKARLRIQERLAEESSKYDQLLLRLRSLYMRGLLEADTNPQVFSDGASYLVDWGLDTERAKLRELFHAFEEKIRLLRILDQFLEETENGIAIQVGLEEADPSMAGLSLIGSSLLMENGSVAKFAVLGPIRMNYERVISVVNLVTRVFPA
jgi:heat-inducible transcriptional repressor